MRDDIDTGHNPCCDCDADGLGAHCEAHYEDRASGYPEMTCGGYAVASPDHADHDDSCNWMTCDACDDEAGEPYEPCVDTDGSCNVCGECRHICATFDKALRDKATDDYYASERDETRDEIDALLSWDEAIDADGIIDAS